MTTNAVYEKMIEHIPPGIERDVMSILSRHIGRRNRIKRDALIMQLFNRVPKNWKDSTEDRQVRHAIAKLQDRGYLIVSDSGGGGYYLPSNKDERNAYIAELESRRERLDKKIRALRSAEKVTWEEQEKYIQLTFTGVA